MTNNDLELVRHRETSQIVIKTRTSIGNLFISELFDMWESNSSSQIQQSSLSQDDLAVDTASSGTTCIPVSEDTGGISQHHAVEVDVQ